MTAETTTVPPVAHSQAGVFTARQALEAGWSPRVVRRRLDAGRWVGVAGAGLALPSTLFTPYQRAVAAVLTWPHIVISHGTAGLLHGFPISDDGLAHVITDRGHRSRRSIEVHVLRIDTAEVTTSSRLAVTTRNRSILDCLATLGFDEALDLYAYVTSRRWFDHARLEAAILDRSRCHGTPQLRRLAEITATGAVSGAEHRLHELLAAAAMTGWTAGVCLRDADGVMGVADVLFRDAQVIVEVDGWRAHSSRTSFVQDRRRQNRFTLAGFKVLRVTWDDLRDRPGDVIAQIRAALDGR